MSKKSELSAMYYLAKNNPDRFRLQHYGSRIVLESYNIVIYGMDIYRDWQIYHAVDFNENEKANINSTNFDD